MVSEYQLNKRERSKHADEEIYRISCKDNCQDGECIELPTKMNSDDDIISQILGQFGIWQLRSVFIVFLCKIPAAWFFACTLFTAPDIYPNQEFTCDTSIYGGTNYSVSADQCYVLVTYVDGNYALRQCQQFNYRQGFHSLIVEFDLVCLCDIFVAWSQYWNFFGIFIGGIVATRLLRIVSPRCVYILGIWTLISCGVITALVNDFSLHCSFRCLVAVCCSLMMTSGHAILIDITRGKCRQCVLIVYEIFWSLGLILLPATAAFAHSWRQIVVVITMLSFIIVLLLPWLPDSARWQLQHSEPTYAVNYVFRLIVKAAGVNDRCYLLPTDLANQLELLSEQLRSQSQPARWLELWRGQKQAKLYMLSMHMALAVLLISHCGLLLNIRSFGRDYLVPNTIGIGLAEILGYLLAIYLTLKHNAHKWHWAGIACIIGGSIGCTCWLFTHVQMPEIYDIILWMFLASVPKAAAACAHALIIACMGEFMPVEKREPFAFSVITWARVWMLSASFLTVLRELNIALSLSAFCVLVILGGICICCLRTPQEEPQEEQQVEQQSEREEDNCNTHL